ncbi:hypothetical protein EVAR_37191_1 [Eumeta japonica]|uniref:Uncharacterized protein n=1 Tax=Eumeta variegata TaxID=151549 RepID=A0A4C1WJ45_EUMVA|nr:hypothetical protein EVAR_37191_1 [Eumeta japonica]
MVPEDLECHPVLEVTAEPYNRLIKAGYIYVGLQRHPVWYQSPLVQCSRCLGFGHVIVKTCLTSVPIEGAKLAQSASPGTRKSPQDVFIASNPDARTLHIKRLARNAVSIIRYQVVQKVAPRRGPVKAAINPESGVDVEDDQTPIDENVTFTVAKAGSCRIGIVSVYFKGGKPTQIFAVVLKEVSQTLTDHDGFTQYLFRFKLRDSPYNACDPVKIQDVLHVFKDCDTFHQEHETLEKGIEILAFARGSASVHIE